MPSDKLRMAVAAILCDFTAVEIAEAAIFLGVEESVAISRACGEWDEAWSVNEFAQARIESFCDDVAAKCGTTLSFDRETTS